MRETVSALASLPTRLGYGAANLGNMFREVSDDEAWAVLEAAWDGGVRYFDTAPHYGLGLSERRLGAFLRTKPRDEFIVSTKAGRLIRPNPDDDGGLDLEHAFHVRTDVRREPAYDGVGVRTSLEESLERMGLDRIDVLYLHDPERSGHLDQAIAEAYPAMQDMRAEGLVTAVGIGSMVSDALARSVREADLDVIMIAGRYTLLEQPAAAEVLPACHERDTAVVAASVFNSGLLATTVPSRDSRYEYGAIPDDIWDRVTRIAAICDAHGVPLPAAALQFPFQDSATASVIVGTARAEQIRQNLDLVTMPIPDSLWDELRAEGLTPA
ncbi:aldo/keto reductase [Microbacterium sp. ZW T5_56]|uniref:aldo/keto reductase n=1 Tax=Microbacterium sp. ZW T5_56 TaxID=3378081 RepID=UPI0038532638